MVDRKYYVQSGRLSFVGHFSGADMAAAFIAMRAIETGRVDWLGPTIKIGWQGFDSPPTIELHTAFVLAAVQGNA